MRFQSFGVFGLIILARIGACQAAEPPFAPDQQAIEGSANKAHIILDEIPKALPTEKFKLNKASLSTFTNYWRKVGISASTPFDDIASIILGTSYQHKQNIFILLVDSYKKDPAIKKYLDDNFNFDYVSKHYTLLKIKNRLNDAFASYLALLMAGKFFDRKYLSKIREDSLITYQAMGPNPVSQVGLIASNIPDSAYKTHYLSVLNLVLSIHCQVRNYLSKAEPTKEISEKLITEAQGFYRSAKISLKTPENERLDKLANQFKLNYSKAMELDTKAFAKLNANPMQKRDKPAGSSSSSSESSNKIAKEKPVIHWSEQQIIAISNFFMELRKTYGNSKILNDSAFRHNKIKEHYPDYSDDLIAILDRIIIEGEDF